MGQAPAVCPPPPGVEKRGKGTSLQVETPEGAQPLQGHTLAPSLPHSFDTRGKGGWMPWAPAL